MTRAGEPNRWGRFVMEEGQAERIAAGEPSAVWAFMQDNMGYIVKWANKKVYWHLNYLFGYRFYEVDELIDQIFIDLPFYNLDNEKAICVSMWWSFKGIGVGGYRAYHKTFQRVLSLDAPLTVSERSGDKGDGNTLGDILPAYTPLPDRVLEDKEHVKAVAGHYYREIKEALGVTDETDDGATIGEILDYQSGKENTKQKQFRDIIEYIFHGYLFEEVKRYAKVG